MKKFLLFLTFIYVFAQISAVFAQQTIFNVPTVDVLNKGETSLLLDTSFKFDKDPNNVVNRFSSFVPRVVFGVGGNIEVGANFNGNIQPGDDQPTLVLTGKAKVYERRSWAIAAGDDLFVPLENRAYNLGNYAYLEVGKTFSTKTRLTAGGYYFTKNVVAPNAARAGGQFGFEQTVTEKFSVVADWFTGKHSLGYFTPGVSVKLSKRAFLTAGYSLGNANLKRGNHFFSTELGYNF